MFEFYKMHGSGNDFIMIDNRNQKFPDQSSVYVKKLCQAHTGIGSDGLILLEKSDIADFRMRYFNADGHESNMCANGSRCTCYFAHLLGMIDTKHTFEAGDGVHLGKINNGDRVRVEVLQKKESEIRTFPVDFKLPNFISFIDFLNTGVPHVILASKDVDSVPVEELGKQLRFHSYYAPEGTNVNFVEEQLTVDSLSLKVRTYERGVDAETLSCGSGVTASAISFYNKYKPNSREIEIDTRGGSLIVNLSEDLKSIYLEGPVKVIYKGNYIEEEGFR